ncbi:hypothetical protein LTS15_008425 [Exophiala xenobiotica]|nr:hypothetical protein LTS15_008425 [Exophiala xenobiotica]
MADTVMADSPAIESATPFSLRPRFKISDLPLVKEQRSTIDTLLLKFKKQGGYDSLRKQVWASYNTSDAKTALADQIHAIAEAEIEKDPNLLSRERGKAATLIQGAVDRSGIYQDVESRIDTEIAKHLSTVLDAVRDIRKADVGAGVAAEEEQRGCKTDEQYKAETENRAAERDRNRSRMEQLLRETAELKAKIKQEEERKRKKEEAKREEEERKKREAEEEERKLARQKRREEEEKREAERVKARDERHKKREEERKEREARYEKERERERDRERDRRDRDRDRDRDREQERARDRDRDRDRDLRKGTERRGSRVELTDKKDIPTDEKDLEATALELLLNEGKRLAEKSKQRPEYDFNKAEIHDSSRRYDGSDRHSSRRDKSRDGHRREKERRSRSRDRRPSIQKEKTVKKEKLEVSAIHLPRPKKKKSPKAEECGLRLQWVLTAMFLVEVCIALWKNVSVRERDEKFENSRKNGSEEVPGNMTVIEVKEIVTGTRSGSGNEIEIRIKTDGTGTATVNATQIVIEAEIVTGVIETGTGTGTGTEVGKDSEKEAKNETATATATGNVTSIAKETVSEIEAENEKDHATEIATGKEGIAVPDGGTMTDGTRDEMIAGTADETETEVTRGEIETQFRLIVMYPGGSVSQKLSASCHCP